MEGQDLVPGTNPWLKNHGHHGTHCDNKEESLTQSCNRKGLTATHSYCEDTKTGVLLQSILSSQTSLCQIRAVTWLIHTGWGPAMTAVTRVAIITDSCLPPWQASRGRWVRGPDQQGEPLAPPQERTRCPLACWADLRSAAPQWLALLVETAPLRAQPPDPLTQA